ncbi:hypothetical protein, partial [Alkalicoccus chagannorensis]|uniref:hypothetical protein n=1 Tax=Alkalicoccus chagannorensis TaxID=427072 RepID=UPI0039F0F703
VMKPRGSFRPRSVPIERCRRRVARLKWLKRSKVAQIFRQATRGPPQAARFASRTVSKNFRSDPVFPVRSPQSSRLRLPEKNSVACGRGNEAAWLVPAAKRPDREGQASRCAAEVAQKKQGGSNIPAGDPRAAAGRPLRQPDRLKKPQKRPGFFMTTAVFHNQAKTALSLL